MKICLNMASMRWKNWPLLRMNYERAFTPGVDLTWQIVIYKDEIAAVPEREMSSVRQPWINILWLWILAMTPMPSPTRPIKGWITCAELGLSVTP